MFGSRACGMRVFERLWWQRRCSPTSICRQRHHHMHVDAVVGAAQGKEELLSAVQKPWRGPTSESHATSERSGERLQPQHAQRASVPYYDPLKTPLPAAPSMRLYCGYGHGIATERAYHYHHSPILCEDQQCPAGMLETDLSNTQASSARAAVSAAQFLMAPDV